MRVVIQRVENASVSVGNGIVANISKGLVVFLGVEEGDNVDDVDWLVRKVVNLRIFADENDKMNLSLIDILGSILVISQFTLHASTKRGNRPSFIKAAKPEKAKFLYDMFIEKVSNMTEIKVKTGIFGSIMKIDLLNDGPVTILMDSKSKE